VTEGGEQSLRSRVERPSRGMLARRVTRPSAALTESTVIAQRPAAQCAGPQAHAGSAPRSGIVAGSPRRGLVMSRVSTRLASWRTCCAGLVAIVAALSGSTVAHAAFSYEGQDWYIDSNGNFCGTSPFLFGGLERNLLHTIYLLGRLRQSRMGCHRSIRSIRVVLRR
jgi:hypothetical protein